MISYSCPFRTTYDANVFNRENGEEKVLVSPIVPVLVHLQGWSWFSLAGAGG